MEFVKVIFKNKFLLHENIRNIILLGKNAKFNL